MVWKQREGETIVRLTDEYELGVIYAIFYLSTPKQAQRDHLPTTNLPPVKSLLFWPYSHPTIQALFFRFSFRGK